MITSYSRHESPRSLWNEMRGVTHAKHADIKPLGVMERPNHLGIYTEQACTLIIIYSSSNNKCFKCLICVGLPARCTFVIRSLFGITFIPRWSERI